MKVVKCDICQRELSKDEPQGIFSIGFIVTNTEMTLPVEFKLNLCFGCVIRTFGENKIELGKELKDLFGVISKALVTKVKIVRSGKKKSFKEILKV